MESLLAGTARNYLPPDWAELDAAMRSASIELRRACLRRWRRS